MGITVFPAASGGASYSSQPLVVTSAVLADGVLTSASNTVSITANGSAVTLFASQACCFTINGVDYVVPANTPTATQAIPSGTYTVTVTVPYVITSNFAAISGFTPGFACGGLANSNNGSSTIWIYACAASTTTGYISTNNASTWTTMTVPSTATVYGAAYHNGYFVLYPNANYAWYSTNGTSWTQTATFSGGYSTTIGVGGGYFFFGGQSVQTFTFFQAGSFTTPYKTDVGTADTINGNIAYYRGQFKAIGASYTYTGAPIPYSLNQVSGVPVGGGSNTMAAGDAYYPMTTSGLEYEYAGSGAIPNTGIWMTYSGTNVYSNYNWNEGTQSNSNTGWVTSTSPISGNSISYVRGIFLIFGNSSTNAFAWSYNGITWTSGTTTAGAFGYPYVSYGGGQWITGSSTASKPLQSMVGPQTGSAGNPINFAIYQGTNNPH